MDGCKGGVVLLHGRLRLSLHGGRSGCSAGLAKKQQKRDMFIYKKINLYPIAI